MTRLSSLVRRGDTAALSPVARRVAIALAVLTPLLIAGVAVTALVSPTQSAAAPSGPALPAAVVNLDQMVQIDQNGTQTPVLAGKLLVSELTSGTSGQGFTWNVTDADTASSGLKSGHFAAVVTIPENFSASYVSISGSNPVQAQLQVQTNGANSYVTEMLASALSTNLQAAMSTQVTKQFVTSSLGAFSTLHDQIGQAASGAQQLATGAGQLSTGAAQLASGAGQLSTGIASAASGSVQLDAGAQALAGGLDAISTATTDLPTYANLLSEGSSGVTAGIGVLKQRLGDEAVKSLGVDDRLRLIGDGLTTLRADAPTLTPDEVQARLDVIIAQLDTARAESLGTTAGLGLDALGVTVLEAFSTEVSDGQAKFAADLPQLTDGIAQASSGATQLAAGTSALSSGLGQLATGGAQLADGAAQLAPGAAQLASGTTQLASGLGQAATAIPSYTTAQQDTISTVVANPVVTQKSDIAALPSPAAAIAAVAVPLALWIGAFAVYLLLVPFTRRALASTASTFRVVTGALAPALLLGLVQAVVVAVVMFFVGADPAHLAGSVLFSLFLSAVFVMLHQGLVALFGQAGRLLSLGLIVVQVAAAAVIIPNGLSSPLYTGLSTVLPLAHAITGMQALIGGGSLAVVAREAVVLLVFAAVGLVFSIIAVVRARSRSLVTVTVPAAPTPPVAALTP
ncbi:YhgE/Pip family protein [Herbiconiux sp. 11R-BC]|uniref:YhgE/Pip family protein n=1 Tax=Herbiconiux sp. 11R-BC TaxID=3111637 RepID=UPI003BFB85DB